MEKKYPGRRLFGQKKYYYDIFSPRTNNVVSETQCFTIERGFEKFFKHLSLHPVLLYIFLFNILNLLWKLVLKKTGVQSDYINDGKLRFLHGNQKKGGPASLAGNCYVLQNKKKDNNTGTLMKYLDTTYHKFYSAEGSLNLIVPTEIKTEKN